ncbi:hypothetical protein SAMN05421747_12213 [Parapedobacter composti]|uniref:Uncharacterized protein n=1 Tax=Parapedobacter composti TaxID=623281 RepID=A0A1I1LJL3_9SPHI|nr:hypothetical protein SAMN05421747_12213 [Parapedobacter composti]
MVRLKARKENGVRNMNANFNSCMVRLKEGPDMEINEGESNFNSCMVRLKALEVNKICKNKAISIPVWCD